MLPAPSGTREAARLARLRETGVLDTAPEERFDRLTRLTAQLLGVPIALVSLVDADRQWFKSRFGLDATETPRDVSFCGHTIHESGPFVVEDAHADERFSDNPLVTGGPNVRFYAGWPLRAASGEAVGTLCAIDHVPRTVDEEMLRCLHDIAELVERELFYEDITSARDTAQRASEAKSRFVANVSHELRTPLHAVVAASELLVDANEPERRGELLETMRAAGDSLTSLINEVLDMSRMESGRFELHSAPFALHDVLQDAHRVIVGRGGREGLEIRLEVENAPQLDLFGDGPRLRQVLINLMQNAVKFTEKGRVRLAAEAKQIDGERATILFEVADTGIGMTEEQVERVFQAYEQASSDTSRNYGGAGLGLAICKDLVAAMGGDLRVGSRYGSGSRFWFELQLPIAQPRETHATFDLSSLGDEALKVFLLDDNPTIRRMTEAQVKTMGWEISSAGSAARGLQSLSLYPHDVILLDLQMPDLDGLEVLRTLRAARGPNADTPVVMLTGSAFEQDRQACIAAGADGFLPKPARRADLEKAMRNAVRKRRARAQRRQAEVVS